MEALDVERRTAAAVFAGIWVIENKALAVQAAGVFQGHAQNIKNTLRVDGDFLAVAFEDLVAIAGDGVEVHFVGQA